MPVPDPELENLNETGEPPVEDPYLPITDEDIQESDEQPQSSKLQTSRQLADKAVNRLLENNAPKGTPLRALQSRVRLLRSKYYGARNNLLRRVIPKPLHQVFGVGKPVGLESPVSAQNALKSTLNETTLGKGAGEIGSEAISSQTASSAIARKGAIEVGENLVKQTATKAAATGAIEGAAATTGGAAVTGAAGAAAGEAAVVGAAAAEAAVPVAGWVAAAVTIGAALLSSKKVRRAIAVGIWVVILAVLMPVIILFSLKALNTGVSILPSTPVQKQQATVLSAIAGNQPNINKVSDTVIDNEISRYNRIKAQANQNSTIDSTADKVIADLKRLKTLSDKTAKLALLQSIIDEQKNFESSLPYGSWIVADAKRYIGYSTTKSDSGENVFQCNVSTRSCASFVSTVLIDVGAPNPFAATTTALWNNPSAKTVIDRGGAFSLSALQPGDIVWFGTGTTANYSGALFNHVGIYVGNGQIINTSSSQLKVVQEAISVFTGDMAVNGVKRFGQ